MNLQLCLVCDQERDATIHNVPRYKRVPGGYGHPFQSSLNMHYQSLKRQGYLYMALEEISIRDPVSDTCGPDAPRVCENCCIGCIARLALQRATE